MGWVLILLVFLIYLVTTQIRQRNKGSWEHASEADLNAQIIHVETEKVRCARNDMRYRTVIRFSDGFTYYSYKTNKEFFFRIYKISIDENLAKEIVEDAIKAHRKAVLKIQNGK